MSEMCRFSTPCASSWSNKTSFEALIGNDTIAATTGIFHICGADDPRPAFNATVTATLPPSAAEDVIEVFDECVENAPGSDLSISAFSSLASLQENSITTTVQSAPEIQSLNTEPTIYHLSSTNATTTNR